LKFDPLTIKYDPAPKVQKAASKKAPAKKAPLNSELASGDGSVNDVSLGQFLLPLIHFQFWHYATDAMSLSLVDFNRSLYQRTKKSPLQKKPLLRKRQLLVLLAERTSAKILLQE
jgi:hypothetical protein